jgi:type I restriction enzyme S subunit
MELKTGYKQTEIGVIPMDWEVNTVQELIDDKFIVSHLDGNHGALYPKSHEFKENGVPYIGANDFLGGKVSFNNCKYLSNERAEEFRKGIAIDGDVLFAHNATVGPVAFLETSLNYIILSTTATYFRCDNNNLINKYLIYALQSPSFIHQYSAIMSQSTRCQVPITAQRKLNLIIPTIAEQTAIANALSDADGLITGLEKLIAKKRNIKQGAMQQLLQPKEDWEVKKLGGFLDYEQPTPYLVTDTEYNNNNQTPVLTAGKTFILGYTNEDHGIFKKLPVIIFDDFTTAIKYVNFPFKAKSSAMKMLVPRNVNVNLRFIYEIMQQIKFPLGDHKRHWIGEYQHIDINIPKSLAEQTRIATILSDMDAELSALEQKLEKYKKVKLGMMQELLTGKTRLV